MTVCGLNEREREIGRLFCLGYNRRTVDGIYSTEEEYVESLGLELQILLLGRVDRRNIARMIELRIVRDGERVKMINEMIGAQDDESAGTEVQERT